MNAVDYVTSLQNTFDEYKVYTFNVGFRDGNKYLRKIVANNHLNAWAQAALLAGQYSPSVSTLELVGYD